MKSDFIFVLIALGTIVCVTCAYPISSSEIQQDRGKDHASIAKDLLILLNQAADSQEDYSDKNTESAEAESYRKIARKVKDFAGRLRGRRPMDSGGTVPAPEFTYIPGGGSPVKPDRGQGYSRSGAPTRGGGGQYGSRTRSRGPGRDLGEGVSAPEFTYIPGGGQGAQEVGNGYKIQTSSSQLYGNNNNNMQAEEQIAVVRTMLAPYAVDVVHLMGQFTGRAIKGVKNFIFNRRRDSKGYRYTGQYPGADPRHREGPPQYPQAPLSQGYAPPQNNDPSSNEELLELKLLQEANEQRHNELFRRDRLNQIKKPKNLRPISAKPNHETGSFESIKQFIKNLYQE